MKRRVVITGMGAITSLGERVESVWQAILEGRSGIGPITRFDCSTYSTRFGGECTSFDVTKFGMDGREAKRLDRFAAFAYAASTLAVADAGLDFAGRDTTRYGVLIGTGIGGLETIEETCEIMLNRGHSRVSPFTVPKMMANAASGNVSIKFGLRGPSTSVATACATGANAIGDAARFIQHGYADMMIAGGSEATICRLGVSSFAAARALSTRNDEPTKASRPWDKNRDGFVMGEGAGILILEELEHAKKRGAKIYAELAGYGMTADAHHITAPIDDGSGASRAMDLALADAGLAPDAIQYVNAHGTSTQLGDVAEVRALKRTFGEHAKKLMVSSTKSHIGHLLGASGGVEAIFATLAVAKGVVPPTINLDEPDEGCDLDFVPHTAREARVDVAISNSFGFGGHNACLLVRKF